MQSNHTKSNLKNSTRMPEKTTPVNGQQDDYEFRKIVKRFLLGWLPKNKWLKGIVLTIISLVLIALGVMYGIAQWYIHTESSKPLTMGVSFIPDYAESLGLNPQATMSALLGIGVKQFRLVSYWSDIEPSPGQYNFSQLDWEFADADAAHAKVILTVGLRQPRWPECHPPSWVNTSEPTSQWQPQLEQFMTAVINRYKNNPALESYQLENEYFLQGFGTCTNFSRNRLISEYNLVKSLDPKHPIIIGRSDNAIGIPVHQPQPNEFSISIYRRVWDASVTHRYLEYPFPAWFYAFLAGWQELADHRNMMVGELQAEAWAPNSKTIPEISLAEQNKSMNAQRLQGVFQYGKATGMRSIDLWGAEYWYYRLEILHDPSLWNVAKEEFGSNK
jgi:hypothetical protein